MKTSYLTRLAVVPAVLLAVSPVYAGDPQIVDASASCTTDRVCRIDVTVLHSDSGWDHYVNRWDVLSPGGEVLASRELLHPHVEEQPFTRSLSGVEIPVDAWREIRIRVIDSVHGAGSEEFLLRLPGFD